MSDSLVVVDGPGLVVVAHEVVAASFTGVTSVGWSPVVKHVVCAGRLTRRQDDLKNDCRIDGECWDCCGVPASCDESWHLGLPNTSVAVFAFAVHGIGEAFTQDAPLHGEVLFP